MKQTFYNCRTMGKFLETLQFRESPSGLKVLPVLFDPQCCF